MRRLERTLYTLDRIESTHLHAKSMILTLFHALFDFAALKSRNARSAARANRAQRVERAILGQEDTLHVLRRCLGRENGSISGGAYVRTTCAFGEI